MSEIFTPSKENSELAPLSEEHTEKIIQSEIEDAVDFIESEISYYRNLTENYFQGKTRLKTVEGRSKIVVTKVRDVIKSIQPSIARVFLQNRTVAEFEADAIEDEIIAAEQTLFGNRVFWRYGGYKATMEAVTDALMKRVGVVRVDYEKVEVASHEVRGVLDEAQLAMAEKDPNITITAVSDPDEMGMMEIVATRKVIRPKWSIECLPPEEFFVDDQATDIGDCSNARIWGMRKNMRVHDVVAMGIPMEELHGASYTESETLDLEKFTRLGYEIDHDTPVEDKAGREILVCEGYIRVDADGDGLAELNRFVTVGENYKLVEFEPVNYSKLVVFRTDIHPHVFFPISVAEDVVQDQDAATALLRSIIDNTALVNNPRTEANENVVNLEDLKSNEIGAIIRVKAMGQINELVTPFVAGQTLPVLQAIHDQTELRTGVTRMSQGIDPDALQSTSRVAANGMMQAADARMEMMARNIAEMGMKDLFYTIIRIAMHEMKEPTQIKTEKGEYEDINPAFWHDQLGIWTNVGLGNGRIDEKVMTLKEIAQMQYQTMSQLGMSKQTNPVGGYAQFQQTMKDVLALQGIRHSSKYFPSVPEQVLQQMDQRIAQMKQGDQGGKAAAMALVEAEKVKAQAKIQTDSAKLQQQGQVDLMKMQQKEQSEMRQLQAKLGFDNLQLFSENDRERDKMAMDFAVQSKKVELDAATKREVAKETAKQRDVATGD